MVFLFDVRWLFYLWFCGFVILLVLLVVVVWVCCFVLCFFVGFGCVVEGCCVVVVVCLWRCDGVAIRLC